MNELYQGSVIHIGEMGDGPEDEEGIHIKFNFNLILNLLGFVKSKNQLDAT